MRQRSRAFWLRGSLIAIVTLAVVCAVLLIGRQIDERVFMEPLCELRLKRIKVRIDALCNDSVPPAIIYGPGGRPFHSWRALVAAAGERVEGHTCPFDFAKPWYAPGNRRWEGILNDFACPDWERRAPNCANYLAVIGDNTMWPANGCVTIPAEIHSEAILVIEVPGSTVVWMEPRDVTVEELWELISLPSGNGICSPHPRGLPYLAADGTVRYLPRETDFATLRRLVRRDPRCKVVPCDDRKFLRRLMGSDKASGLKTMSRQNEEAIETCVPVQRNLTTEPKENKSP